MSEMRTVSEEYDFDEPVDVGFGPLWGDDVHLEVQRIVVADQVWLVGSTSVSGFADAAARGAFHLDHESPYPGWEPTVAVDVTLLLRQPVATRFSSADQLVEELLSDATSALRRTEAWWALEATQKVDVPDAPDADSAFGLRTRWADLA